MAQLLNKKYIVPFILITSLFFIWGFARSILDVLNKHFQNTLHISIAHSTMVQTATYLGYFLMALPAGIIITKYGYRRGVVAGLGLFAAGCFIFIPGQSSMSFNLFAIALFVIGCGLVMLETSANPYVAELGPVETTSSRLNLAQSFNGLGCILGPVAVGGFLFKDAHASVSLPYSLMGLAVVIVAAVFMKVKLPEIQPEIPGASTTDSTQKDEDGVFRIIGRLWKRRHFRIGLLALLCYEVSEISINSLFINYTTSDGWLTPTQASMILSFGALGIFMVARVIGSYVMSRVAATTVLVICAAFTLLGSLLVMADLGTISRCGLFACYAFEAIMFPTIFAITLTGVGRDVKIASSFLMMTPVGGAIGTMIMGLIADKYSLSTSFLVPAAGYLCVLLYSTVVYTHYKNRQNQ